MRAHRLSWTLANGPIPDGMFVCHRCDNPPCVNPAHLFLGTNADNVRDMFAKGRAKLPAPKRGEFHRDAKLTEDDVRAIRSGAITQKLSHRDIAARYGVSEKTIWQVIHRKTWVHVAAGLVALALSSRVRADDALTLSRVCWLESNWSHADCTAIAHVIRVRAKRAGSTFTEMAIAYSALDSGTDRAVFAAQLPDGDEPTWTMTTNARWAKLRLHAAAVLSGKVGNVCRGATHWGARNLQRDLRRAVDAVKAGRWRVVQCSAETANAFYAEVRR